MKHLKLALVAVLCLVVAFAAAPLTAAAREDLATVNVGPAAVVWQPKAAYDTLVLTVSGPHGVSRHEFAAGILPSLDIFASDGYPLADGRYSWELRAQPAVSPQVKRTLDAARASGDYGEVDALRQQGVLPDGPLAQSGAFAVAGGAFVSPDLTEDAAARPGSASAPLAASVGEAEIVSMSAADQVILDDLIVDGSACIGQDCVNGESFGFDTIRLKENNLRIKFDDTSNSASFPKTDWQLLANETSNGGKELFSIEDVTNGRIPFTIEATAPNNALYVEASGEVGLGTSEPVVELHIVDGDTPTLRLQQDGSSGFTPQTWDVAGNEANFFIRDVTNGSKLVFKIKPGAPTSSIFVAASGNVGLGTESPDQRLDVDGGAAIIQSSSGVAKLTVDENGAGAATLLELENEGQLTYSLTRSDLAAVGASGVNRWNLVHNGTLDFTLQGSGVAEMSLANGGDLTIAGDLTVSGAGGCSGCDGVFQASWPLASIEDHAEAMWTNSFLPGVGPTPDGPTPIKVYEKTTGMLQELEIAHIYIQQLNERLEALEAKLEEKE